MKPVRLQEGWALPLLYLVLASLLLMWPAFVNGGPFLFNDTSSYVRGADAGFYRLTGVRTDWSEEIFARHVDRPAKEIEPAREIQAPPDPRDAPVTLAGRSIYYGAILYVSQLFGGFWLAIAFQAMLVALGILLTCRFLTPPRPTPQQYGIALAIVAGLSILSPVAYFASFAMPDIFAALGLLASAHLAFFWGQQGRRLRAFWFALLTLALLSHNANLLIVAALICLAIVTWLFPIVPVSKAGVLAVVLALLIGIGGEALFSAAVRQMTGAPPGRPPFLTARLIDDGPGYRYLVKTCPGNGFDLCRFLPRLPMNSDQFLWSADPATGVFAAASPAEQRTLSAEQIRFALAVARDRPVSVAASSARSFRRQIGAMGLADFNYPEQEKLYFETKLPPRELAQVRASAAFRSEMPVEPIRSATPVIVVASLILTAFTLLAMARGAHWVGNREGFVFLVLAGLLLNAAACGALSTPHDRYQSRIIWLLPLLAACIAQWRPGLLRFRHSGGQRKEAALVE